MKAITKKVFRNLCYLLLLSIGTAALAQEPWNAPKEAEAVVNPLLDDDKAVTKGKKIYFQICAACHGRTGIGDGPNGKTLKIKPADHTSAAVQEQSDGVLFWKITNGRGDMPNYSQLLSKKQRWQVIQYIRLLNKN